MQKLCEFLHTAAFDGIFRFRRAAASAGICLLAAGAALGLAACGASEGAEENAAGAPDAGDNVVNVYNWGEYIDPDVIDMFEEETGIKVVYDMFETNEEMYPVIDAGGVIYDAVCPSDYMIEKMIKNGLLQELRKENLQNLGEIGEDYMALSAQFDPDNRYAVPYTWGTVGIIYNKGMLDELGIPYPTRWSDLWDPRLRGEILMQDSVRDAFMVALKKEGLSANPLDDGELDRARDELIRQKPIVQAYVVDQVRDKMIGGEAAVGVIYSGELLFIQEELEDTDIEMGYVIPEEGTNLWVDGWVIPKNARHRDNAEKWIDFLCRPDIALLNFEYITYSTPNVGAFELLDEEIQENEAVFPDMDEVLVNGEVYHYFGDAEDAKYNDRWKTVKVS